MTFSILLALALPAAAQTLRAPALGRSVLPVGGTLSALSSTGLAPKATLPTSVSPRVTLPTPAVITPVALPLPPSGEARVKVAAVVEAVSVPLAKAEGNPAAQAPVLSNLFEGRRVASPSAVVAGVSIHPHSQPLSRPAGEGRVRGNLVADEPPEPPAPARPVWKTAGLYLIRAGGFLGALYGGFRVGDMAYMGLGFLGPWGFALGLPLLAGSAWWLGSRRDSSPLGRFIMAGLYGSAGFVVAGQQVWDLVHTPLGLIVGIPIGIALALVASGVLPRRKKFTGEPPNLNPSLPRH